MLVELGRMTASSPVRRDALWSAVGRGRRARGPAAHAQMRPSSGRHSAGSGRLSVKPGAGGACCSNWFELPPAYPSCAAPSEARSVGALVEVGAPADLPNNGSHQPSGLPRDCGGTGRGPGREGCVSQANSNARRYTRPTTRLPRLDRLLPSAPFSKVFARPRAHAPPRPSLGPAASFAPFHHAFDSCCPPGRESPGRLPSRRTRASRAPGRPPAAPSRRPCPSVASSGRMTALLFGRWAMPTHRRPPQLSNRPPSARRSRDTSGRARQMRTSFRATRSAAISPTGIVFGGAARRRRFSIRHTHEGIRDIRQT